MAGLSETWDSLHPLEKAVLPFLEKSQDVTEIINQSGKQEVEVIRPLTWLQNKGFVSISEKIEEIIVPGKEYSQSNLPESRFLHALSTLPQSISQIKKSAGLNDSEIGASIGVLMRIKAVESISISGERGFKVTELGKKYEGQGLPTKQFIIKASQSQPLKLNEMSSEDKTLATELKKRGLVDFDIKKNRTVVLTQQGRDLLAFSKTAKHSIIAESVTPELLKSGKWKTVKFRVYNLDAPVPRAFFGKPQPYREFLEKVRESFVAMGFEEMTGPIVESEFWNMDALFMPQFHSARDIHDAYYLKEPKFAEDLPKELVKKVKQAHENGFGTGSRGWRYEFDEKKTSQLVLRSQDTSISPRILASKDLKIPGKYFQMVRCFRYDVIDATHLADFNQIGGFVIDKNLNLGNLIWLLKMFAKKFCNTDKVRVVPSYFPFTEPSVGLYAKHPTMGWIELGGAGIFRPEMVGPLVGKVVPVIAWGIGIDRVAMFNLGINDIRNMFSHDLEFLRNAKVI